MFKIKNGKLVMYDVDEKYRDYLRKYDKKISEKGSRKFYGILVSNNNMDYYIPFTSKKNKKTNDQVTVNIYQDGKIIAKLLINNMIPVKKNNVKKVNITREKFKEYFNEEISYLRNDIVINEILDKVNNAFDIVSKKRKVNIKKYNFFKSICCDYPLLEEKCKEYKD